MTDKLSPDLQHGLAAVHQISIHRKAHTTTDEAVELFRYVLEKHAKAAAPRPQPTSEKARKPYFSKEAVQAAHEKMRKHEEYLARMNPKGVPVIFPSFD